MKYDNITIGRFIDRPNRFTAHVEVDGVPETVHVKNTGRLRELLMPGAEVWLTEPGTPGRKTRCDLVAVRKDSSGAAKAAANDEASGGDRASSGSGKIFNIDSQAPNKVVHEWLKTQGFDRILPEHIYGSSRMDFYMERGSKRFLMEVKGCTLEVDGVGYFPDAPTERGVKHLRELARAAEEGYTAIAAFVIQMDGVTEVCSNTSTHPEFAEALAEAKAAGVRILALQCHVEPDSLEIVSEAVIE
ncbi:MAG: DNA/RNA nuclease SfsA [Firmicutes bacterium]|nr:DNA/RNA nuclease SfsA [Bacillota bacterium]